MERSAAAPVVVARVEHRLPEPVDLERVLAHEDRPQPARERVRGRHLDDRAREKRGRIGLAEAHNALVGMDADEERVLRPVRPRGVDLR